jgi:hypothetical protein
MAAILGAASLGLIRSHRRSWGRRQKDPSLDQADLLHYGAQFRRRMQASALLGVIGVLLLLGDLLIPWQKAPFLFSIYFGFILLLTGYLVLLAIGDALATASYTRAALARIQAQRRHLEREAAELREKGRSELPVD